MIGRPLYTSCGPVKKKKMDRDIDEVSHYHNIPDPYEGSMCGLDVENFIFKLDMQESTILLFMALSYKPKEICKLLGYKNLGSIYQILTKMRNLQAIKEDF